MAIGDRPPGWAYPTGTENGCTWYSDGHLYGANGRQVETNAEKRRRQEQKSFGAGNLNSGLSYGQIFDDGFQKIANQSHEINKQFVHGMIGTVIAGAAIAGATKYSAEKKKNSGNTANAISKTIRDILCVVGIIVIIVLLCMATVSYLILAGRLGIIGFVNFLIFTLIGCYGIFGFVRVMIDKSFFIHFK